MKVLRLEPPREFVVGGAAEVTIRHVASIELQPNEQVTFVGESGSEYDIVRKEWGYYATPSLNARLVQKGLHAVLVRAGVSGRAYVLLAEAGSEQALLDYVHDDFMNVVTWLDSSSALDAIRVESAGIPSTESTAERPAPCAYCRSSQYRLIKAFTAPPAGETEFASPNEPYSRHLWQCGGCGHFVNQTALDPGRLYAQSYVDATYQAGLKTAFDRVMALSRGKSDNLSRVERVEAFRLAAGDKTGRRVLDIGSGLGVFGAAMRHRGWQVTVLDPDQRAVDHARDVTGVTAIHGDFMAVTILDTYDVVTLNKVLEHVDDPIAFLARAARCVSGTGFVYIELPDGEGAMSVGADREEFFIEHRCAYSATSLSLLIRRSGLALIRLERMREPSGKFTLVAFAVPAGRRS